MSREIQLIQFAPPSNHLPRKGINRSVSYFLFCFFLRVVKKRPFWQGLLEFICRILDAKPAVLCDMHGHSRRFNAFVYGCKGSQSWCPDDWSRNDGQDDYPTMKHKNGQYSDYDDTTSLPVIVIIGS